MSLENELALVAHLLDPHGMPTLGAKLVQGLTPDLFQSSAPRRIFVWVQAKLAAGFTPTTQGLLKACSSEEEANTFREALESAPRITDPVLVLKAIETAYKKKQALSWLQQKSYALDSGDIDVKDILESISEISTMAKKSEWEESDFFEVLERAKAGVPLEELEAQQNLLVMGIDSFDEVVGSGAGTYGALCAMPGLGKTSLMFQWAALSAKAGIKTYAMSLETKRTLLEAKSVAALVASENGKAFVNTVLRKGCTSISNYHTNKIQPGMLTIGFHPAGLAWTDLEARIRSMAAKGYKLFMFDYFGLLEPPQVRGKQDWAMYGEMSKGIKMLAEVLGICIIAVVQPNGEVDYGEKPSPKNLGTTKQIFKDYDFGVYLWQEKQANDTYKAIPGNEHARLLKGCVHKNRQFGGEPDSPSEPEVWIRWEPSLNYFREDREWRSIETQSSPTSSRMRTQ